MCKHADAHRDGTFYPWVLIHYTYVVGLLAQDLINGNLAYFE